MSLSEALKAIDSHNAKDPNSVNLEGSKIPKELLYSQRMTEQLLIFRPEASENLQIAARAQHICRWKIKRENYDSNRTGYLKWREDLKIMHADLTEEILENLNFSTDAITRIKFLIRKKSIKKDNESQALEDVICLVFLNYYFNDFAAKHEDEKIIDIVQKTWAKMSQKGHKAALKLSLPKASKVLLEKALQ